MKTIGIALALWLGGCALDDLDDHDVSSVEQHTNPSTSNYCFTQGGSYWCQDFYTAKWCTGSFWANGWDHTGCTWKGWNGRGVYCTDGWLWDSTQQHEHCP